MYYYLLLLLYIQKQCFGSALVLMRIRIRDPKNAHTDFFSLLIFLFTFTVYVAAIFSFISELVTFWIRIQEASSYADPDPKHCPEVGTLAF